jgi:hypothetical protein
MKIEESDSEEKKRRYKVVRRDTMGELPGEIVYADDATGRCMLLVIAGGEEKKETYDFDRGDAIVILPRGKG